MDQNIKSAFSLLMEKLVLWYELLIKNIPNILVAVIVFIIFLTIAKNLKLMVKRLLPRVSNHRSVNELIATVTYIIITSIGLFTALEIIGLEKTVTSILAGAGVIGLALGFAFQEIASNFASGVLIAIREPYQLGDIVEIDNYVGEVTHIELRTTCITTFQGLEVFIPNKDMFTKPFINYTSTPKRRVDLNVGVSYSDDLKNVESVVRGALSKVDGLMRTEDIEVFFYEFGDSSINFTARFWIHYPNNKSYFEAKHQAIINIKAAFDENNYTIPFPIRTLELGANESSLVKKLMN